MAGEMRWSSYLDVPISEIALGLRLPGYGEIQSRYSEYLHEKRAEAFQSARKAGASVTTADRIADKVVLMERDNIAVFWAEAVWAVYFPIVLEFRLDGTLTFPTSG